MERITVYFRVQFHIYPACQDLRVRTVLGTHTAPIYRFRDSLLQDLLFSEVGLFPLSSARWLQTLSDILALMRCVSVLLETQTPSVTH